MPRAEALASLRSKYPLPDEFILFVSTIEPRKNIATLLHAYRRLLDSYKVSAGLVLAGATGWLSQQIFDTVEQLDLQRHVTFLGRVQNGDLVYLYNLAPLPGASGPLRGFWTDAAGGHGLRHAGGGVQRLQPAGGGGRRGAADRPQQRRGAGRRAATSADGRRAARLAARKGLARARTFTWERAAEETLAVYRRTFDQAGSTP